MALQNGFPAPARSAATLPVVATNGQGGFVPLATELGVSGARAADGQDGRRRVSEASSSLHDTSCTSSRCRTDRDHCAPPWPFGAGMVAVTHWLLSGSVDRSRSPIPGWRLSATPPCQGRRAAPAAPDRPLPGEPAPRLARATRRSHLGGAPKPLAVTVILP